MNIQYCLCPDIKFSYIQITLKQNKKTVSHKRKQFQEQYNKKQKQKIKIKFILIQLSTKSSLSIQMQDTCAEHDQLNKEFICGNLECKKEELMCLECFKEHEQQCPCQITFTLQTIQKIMNSFYIKSFKQEINDSLSKIRQAKQRIIEKLEEQEILIQQNYRQYFDNYENKMALLRQQIMQNGRLNIRNQDIKLLKNFLAIENNQDQEFLLQRDKLYQSIYQCNSIFQFTNNINLFQKGDNFIDGVSIYKGQFYNINFKYLEGQLVDQCQIKYKQNNETIVLGNYDNGHKVDNWTEILDYYVQGQNHYKLLFKGCYKKGQKNGVWTYYCNDIQIGYVVYENGSIKGSSEQITPGREGTFVKNICIQNDDMMIQKIVQYRYDQAKQTELDNKRKNMLSQMDTQSII
ncbi:hypothetical protein pb186bvf_012993 [Paramecium bursaria]